MRLRFIMILLLTGCVPPAVKQRMSVLEQDNASLIADNTDLRRQVEEEKGKNETLRRWWNTHMNNLRKAEKQAQEKGK